MMKIQRSAMAALARVQTQAADVEYFCQKCCGHYSSTVRLEALSNLRCRCGSGELLVYQLAGDNTAAPLRQRPRPA